MTQISIHLCLLYLIAFLMKLCTLQPYMSLELGNIVSDYANEEAKDMVNFAWFTCLHFYIYLCMFDPNGREYHW